MIRIKLRDDDEVFETLLLEDRIDIGPEIRQFKAPGCDAGRSIPVDVPVAHCHVCEITIGDQIGLSEDEQRRLSRWREAAEMTPDEREANDMTAAELGRILDKIVKVLDTISDDCDEARTERIVLEVEPTP